MSDKITHIHWKPNKLNAKPAYIQISDFITAKIQSGEWSEGMQLPSQRDLALLMGVNRSTIVTALDELRSMGLIETHGKGGTRIARFMMPTAHIKSPDWKAHIAEGFHISNLETIQVINRYEFSEDFIRLSSGEPAADMFPDQMMREVLGEVSLEMKQMGYEEPKGMLYLREQICNYVKDFGIQTRPENVLVVSGALQAIQLISIGLLQPGSTVYLEKPSYLYSLNIFQSVGMRRQAIAMDGDGIIPEQLKSVRSRHRQSLLYTVPSYHNPTGVLMSPNRRQELLEVCRNSQIPIVEDDVYRELWLDQPPPNPIKSLDQHGNVLYVGSVSKTLSTGMRIGWLIGPEPVVDRLGDLKMQNDYGSSSLAQLVVGKFLEKGYYAVQSQRVREQLRIRRQVAADALQRYFASIATWDFPKGGYYFWLTFQVPIKMSDLFHEAFKQGILAYPGYLYDNTMNNSLRISYSYAKHQDLRDGIEILSILAKRLLGTFGV